MLVLGAGGCTSAGNGLGGPPPAYPFAGLSSVRGTQAASEARAAYPAVFQVVDDPERTEEVDTRPLRRDLSHLPVDERNYRAIRAIAVAFFELHARAERSRGEGRYFIYSFQATKVIAIPWSFYGEIPDARLRSVILDFYEDVMFGAKPGLDPVRGRFTRMVEDLARKESEAALLARIDELVARGRALTPEPPP